MNENNQEPVNPAPETARPGPGAQLAAQRQALGWTVEQVAHQLNLAPRQVQAIEDENYAALPGMVIARGFLRAYAKLLKIDPVPLLALIPVEQAAHSPEPIASRHTISAKFTESNLPMASRSGSGAKWLAALLLLAAFAAAGWLALPQGWIAGVISRTPTAPAEPAAQPGPVAPDAASGVPLGQAGEDAPAAATESGTQVPSSAPATTAAPASVAPAPAAVPAAAPAAVPATPAVPAATAPPVSAVPVPAAKAGDKLVLKFRQASWVDLKRDDGVALASRLIPAGSTESFDIGLGASLVVGNAAGVEANFRGKTLDLTTGAKNNVARVKLK